MPKVQTTKPTYNFKNIWRNYFNYSPKFATKGILHSVDRNANIALNKKVDSIVKPILKNEGFKVIHLGEDLSRFYTPINKQKAKESLEIPYINKYYKQRLKEIQKDIEEYGEEDVWDTNITEIGIDTVTCIGKYKGIGDSSTLYYFVLVIGGHDEEDLENTTVAVEVITPLDKGEDFFLNEIKKAVSKLNIWKFTGKKIYVNKCPEAVTGSAEMKTYSYKGQIITASSKEEAIQKIVADTDDWDSADLGIDAYDKKKSYMYKHNKGDIMEDRSLYSKINNANIKLGKVFEKKLADIIQKHFKGSKIKYVGSTKTPCITLKSGDTIELEHGWNTIKCDIKKGEEKLFVPPEKRTPPNMITVYVNQRFPYSWKSCCTCNVKSRSSINKCLKIIEDELGKYF